MGLSYIKMILREFKKSFGRFIAIFGIVALGVAILSGLFVTTPDMHDSVDQYYDEHNTADIFIKGTMGLTDEDLDRVLEEENVREVMPSYVMDKIIDLNGKESLTAKIYGIPLIDSEDQVHINKLELIKGRMPENKNECVVERSGPFLKDIKIGENIKISPENEDYQDIDDSFSAKEYQVVGIVANSFHFGKEREVSNVGSGKLDTIIYVDKSSYSLEEYTDFYIVLNKAKEMNTFSSQYEDYSKKNKTLIEDIGEDRSDKRKTQILNKANKEIKDGYEKYYEEKENAESELKDARIEISDGKAELESSSKDIADAESELKDARNTLDRETAQANLEIKDGEKELQDAKAELDRAEKDLESARLKLNDGEDQYASAYSEYQKSKAQIDHALSQLNQGKQELKEKTDELDKGRVELEAAIADIESEIAGLEAVKSQSESLSEEELAGIEDGLNKYEDNLSQLKTQLEALKIPEAEIQAAKAKIDKEDQALQAGVSELNKGREKLDLSRQELDTGRAQYEQGLRELDQGRREYEEGISELERGRGTLRTETANAVQEIEDGERELEEGKADYQQGLKDLEEAETELLEAETKAEEELGEALLDLQEAERDLEDLEDPEWYVLDRDSNISFVSFKLNSDKVDAISKVFPIFFYLVAGLVALTTMTRMVEEERTQIGVLKALGYSKSTIIAKYILYCGLASLLGSIVGQIVGFEVIPRVIWNAYGVIYHLPEFVIDYNKRIALLSSGVAILSTVAATYFAASTSLREKPALLMLPKPPKAGKRILLERIKPLWSALSFNLKSTARNLFRYKKHFYMTVIGVSGCTALLVTGFGLRNSFQDLGTYQFDQIYKYQLNVQLEEDYSQDNLDDIYGDNKAVEDTMELYSDEGQIWFGDKAEDINLVGVDESERLSDFILFRDRKSGDKIDYSPGKVIITEKISEELDIKAGDTVVYKDSDDVKSEFKVDAVTENYIGNFIYMDKSHYEDKIGQARSNNTIYAKTADLKASEQDTLIEKLYENEDVLSTEFISQRRGIFDNLVESINYIVIVIIVASGLLAFIVLYNLTNININERRRELATLKVLGFHDSEVASYIFREITILAVIGTLVGLVLGKVLHQFIIINVEDPDFMFGRNIKLMSYVLSAIITMIFSGIVDLFMLKKVKDIKMVDSMKAND